MKRKLSVAILIRLLVQMVLLGCKPIQSQGTPIVTSVVPSIPPEKEALSAGELQRGGTVVISSGAGTPRHFNPAKEYVPGETIKLARYEGYFLPERPYLDATIIRLQANPNVQVVDLERQIEMPGYIQGLVDHWHQSYGRHEITLRIEASDVVLDIDKAVPCGLIINELVSNALKHAFVDGKPGEICISMRSLDGMVELEVSNNGIGLQADVNLQNLESLGLRLVDLLARQLEGTLDVEVSKGTIFRLAFAAPIDRSSKVNHQGYSI